MRQAIIAVLYIVIGLVLVKIGVDEKRIDFWIVLVSVFLIDIISYAEGLKRK